MGTREKFICSKKFEFEIKKEHNHVLVVIMNSDKRTLSFIVAKKIDIGFL